MGVALECSYRESRKYVKKKYKRDIALLEDEIFRETSQTPVTLLAKIQSTGACLESAFSSCKTEFGAIPMLSSNIALAVSIVPIQSPVNEVQGLYRSDIDVELDIRAVHGLLATEVWVGTPELAENRLSYKVAYNAQGTTNRSVDSGNLNSELDEIRNALTTQSPKNKMSDDNHRHQSASKLLLDQQSKAQELISTKRIYN